MSRIPKAVVNEVYRRAGEDGYLHGAEPDCEACGYPIPPGGGALHHRLPRSAGGGDTAANLMLVHGGVTGGCHNLTEWSIHQNPTRSYRLGHMLRRGQDPETAPPPVVERDLRSLRA